MKNKGITLIALIITIIVMLILAGVTVSYGVKSDLLGKTMEARAKYEKETINEIVLESLVYKEIATTISDFTYIDIPKTAVNVYENLTTNGFLVESENIIDEAGNELGEGAIITLDKKRIDLKVKGKYGEYEGEIESTGINKKISQKKSENTEQVASMSYYSSKSGDKVTSVYEINKNTLEGIWYQMDEEKENTIIYIENNWLTIKNIEEETKLDYRRNNKCNIKCWRCFDI